MKYQFDVEKIVSRLEKYKSELETLYDWKPNLDNLGDLPGNSGELELDKHPKFEKEIFLKSFICEKLNSTRHYDKADFNRICLWIIKDWGRITGGKDDENTIRLINSFLTENETHPHRTSFERIASTSKVAAFLWPETHVIYDARVAYALNWFILSENAGDRYFPIPEGRNSKMNAFDLNVLIRLKHIAEYKTEKESGLDEPMFISKIDNKLFIPKKEAYYELNNLIRLITDRLWQEPKMLYHTEMLLFSLADRQVFREITGSISMNMNSAIEQYA